VIGPLLDWVGRSWTAWFGDSPGPLHTGLLAGGPAHRARVSVFVFNRSERNPRIFVKVALSAREGRYVAEEFGAVQTLASHGGEVASLVPMPLGTTAEGDWLAAAYEVVPGRRLVVPQLNRRIGPIGRRELSRFWDEAAHVGVGLAAAGTAANRDESALGGIVDKFRSGVEIESRARADVDAFRFALERERVRWTPTWQHGDVAVGNVLVHRGKLRLVDWEAARSDYEPWFDLATAPVAAVILARRQTGQSVTEAATTVLSEDGWVGSTLATTVRRNWIWDLPIGWAVALVSMRMANRRMAEDRAMPSDYVDLALALITDRSLRTKTEWAAVQ
jgi:aminoglycoside phosphotransferase (APT) family kinase protein